MSRDEATQIVTQAHTYGELEHLAGITDRYEWWQSKTEEEGRVELKRLAVANILMQARKSSSAP